MIAGYEQATGLGPMITIVRADDGVNEWMERTVDSTSTVFHKCL
jgi:hypothetical protein